MDEMLSARSARGVYRVIVHTLSVTCNGTVTVIGSNNYNSVLAPLVSYAV